MRFVILGATGAVGRGILSLLDERGLATPGTVVALGSPRSAGREVSMGADHVLTLQSPDTFMWSPQDLLFSAVSQDIAELHIPGALAKGVRVIDKSSAFRDKAPLVVPEINATALTRETQLACSPNCIAIPLAMALHPLNQAFGLGRAAVSTYQSVSGAGKKGMDTLFAETKTVLMTGTPNTQESPFGRQIAFNVLPQIGDLDTKGVTEEEQKIQDETRALLGQDVEIIASAVRVPVLIGHGMTVVADFKAPVSLKSAEKLLQDAPGCLMPRLLTTPMDTTGEDDVFIGRLRQPSPTSLAFWIAADNLRKGAALNAIHIAEILLDMPS